MPEDPTLAAKQAGELAAQRVRDGLDGKSPGREGISDAAQAIQRIRDTKGPLSPGDLSFLETFYRDLGKDVYRVPGYLKNDDWADTAVIGPKDRTEMTAAIVGGLLTLSDERRGGGWNRLPKFLQVAGRNEQAMHDLLTNKGMEQPAGIDSGIYDGYTGPQGFLVPITTHAWSDDGKAASSAIDWIADADRSTDPQGTDRETG